VLDDSACPTAIDEGRAMMQLITDLAPGADQAFHTAFGGQAAFAQGILDLANAGCRIIVDDILYLAEPMFQDGIIAQTVNAVVDPVEIFVFTNSSIQFGNFNLLITKFSGPDPAIMKYVIFSFYVHRVRWWSRCWCWELRFYQCELSVCLLWHLIRMRRLSVGNR
jgi:hypothetical protein